MKKTPPTIGTPFSILKTKKGILSMHKEKKLKALVRHMLELDIHHPSLVISLNRQINHLAHKEAQQLQDTKLHDKLILLTDEIAILAESAIHTSAPAIIRVSQQFETKQKELDTLYKDMFYNKKKKTS